jgi:hypothetical protein
MPGTTNEAEIHVTVSHQYRHNQGSVYGRYYTIHNKQTTLNLWIKYYIHSSDNNREFNRIKWNTNMHLSNLIPLISIALILSMTACGGGGNSSDSSIIDSSVSGNNNTSDQSYNITDFNITGTSADNNSGQAQINPAINKGNFSLSFSLEDISEIHYISAYVSLNETLSDSDVEIYSLLCGGALECGYSNPYSTDCFFNNDNNIYCDSDSSNPNDLSSLLNALPQDAFIILESCDGPISPCDTAVYAVQFQ